MIRLRHLVKIGKTVSKKPEVALCSAVSYTDAEAIAAKWIEEEQFQVSGDVIVTKLPHNHEILGHNGHNEDEIKNWYKSQVKYISEGDKGKISIFYVRYLIYADSITKALDLIVEKESSSAVQGEIEKIVGTKIDYMLVPKDQFAAIE